VKNKQKTNNQ